MKLNEWQLGLLVIVVSILITIRLLKDYSSHKGYASIRSWLKSFQFKEDPLTKITDYVYLNLKSDNPKFDKYNLLFAVLEYQAEVDNGGHYQYFWNSSGNNYKTLLKALEKIGAKETLKNFQIVLKNFKKAPDLIKINRQNQMELYKFNSEIFEKEDGNIFNNIELSEKYNNFIKANIGYFNEIINK